MGNLALPADTTLEAARVQFAVLRRLGIEHSLRMTLHLNDTVIEIAKAGVRHRHPDFTPRQVHLAVVRTRLSRDLFQKAFGEIPKTV